MWPFKKKIHQTKINRVDVFISDPVVEPKTVLLLESNPRRSFSTFFLDCSYSICYLKLGENATKKDFTVKLMPGSFIELSKYNGVVTAVFERTDPALVDEKLGAVQVTEVFK